MGLNSEPDCNGVQTDHPIRNLEWYYHGCFSQDVVDEIKRHPDVSYSTDRPLPAHLRTGVQKLTPLL